MDNKKLQEYTRKIVFTGIIVAMALAARSFSQMIYIGGVPAMRVGISGIFAKVPALLFGPFFGGASGAIVDVIGFFMNPVGAYLPWYTITAILCGVMTAVLWTAIKDVKVEKIQKVFLAIFVAIGVIGVINHISVTFFENSFWGKAINSIGKRNYTAIYGLEVIAVIGILLFVIDRVIRKKYQVTVIHKYSFKLLIAVGIATLLETTVNTYIIISTWTGGSTPAFTVFLIPRLIERIGEIMMQAYTIPFILYAYEKFAAKRQ